MWTDKLIRAGITFRYFAFSSRTSKRCFSSEFPCPGAKYSHTIFLVISFWGNTTFSTCKLTHSKACLFLLYSTKFLLLSVHLLTDTVFFAIFLFFQFALSYTLKILISTISPCFYISHSKRAILFCLSHYSWNRYICFLLLRCLSNLGYLSWNCSVACLCNSALLLID